MGIGGKPTKIIRQRIIYLVGFLFYLALSPALYINSSFLEQFIPERYVGYVYSTSAILTLLGFVAIKHILRKYGNYKVFLISLITAFISFAILALDLFLERTFLLASIFTIVFIISFISHSIAAFNLDIFLENITENQSTGSIRGLFLTAVNLAFIIGPLMSGILIEDIEEIGKIYILSGLIFIPIIFITLRYFSNFQDPRYQKSKILQTFVEVRKNPDLYKIFASNFILRIFYAWMIIYTPIFLHDVIGFPLGTVATIVGVGLIPFVILEAPLGKLADTKFGEKEILTIGFIITGLSTGLIAFVSYPAVWLWMLILFTTRVGASMIEIMTETYLFKKINDDDVDIISLYRAVRPLTYLIGPIAASVLLLVLDSQQIFLAFGLVVLSGVWYSLRLRDTL